jgi:selenocysteine lyase/cysteine desulfurase
LDVRARFPIFERLVYINSCSQGALSDAVRRSYEDYLRDWDEHGAPWEPDEIAVTTSVSAGVASLASGLDFAARSKVVLTDLEFPTIGQIWHAQEARGARVVHASPDQLVEMIDDDTLLVSTTHVSYRTGAMVDVPAVVQVAHDQGGLVLLDAYQSVGSLPVDVKELGVDFLAAGVLKYLLGSAGLAFFYCRRELWERARPTATGWFADEDVFAMDICDYSPAANARRFQSGTPPVPSIYAGIAGIEVMQEIGIAETRKHVNALNERLIGGVDELGGTVVTPREPDGRGALICIASTDANALVAALAERGIVTSERDGNLRVSAHAYNTDEDIDAVIEALEANPALLA